MSTIGAVTGVQGTTATLAVGGTGFVPNATRVTISGTGVAVTDVTFPNQSSGTASLMIDANAALGPRAVSVVTAGGTSTPQTFTINPPPPTITSVSTTTLVTGVSAILTLTGTNFVPGATLAVSGTGISVSEVTVVSGTSITARFTAASDAPLGARTATVTTIGGTTAPLALNVNPPVPTLASVSPAQGTRGVAVFVTLTGTNFVAAGTTLSVSGTGITVSAVNVVSSTSLTATFTIDAGADLGAHAVSVTTVGGASGTQQFSVRLPAPTLASVSPSSGVRSTVVAVALAGTGFENGATTVNVSGAGVTAGGVVVVSETQLQASFAIDATAALGAHTVSVTTSAGTSGGQTFTVQLQAPTLASVAPSVGAQGGAQTVTLIGTGFATGGTTVSVSGTNVTVSAVNVTSATSLTALFTVGTSAAVGARNVTVTTAGGSSAAQTFSVVVGPVITSFVALSTHVTMVQPVALNWVTTNAATCSISPTILTVSCNSNVTITPGATTTYTLSASSAGATVTAPVTVFANEPGRFVYSTASADNQLHMFSLNASSGGLTAIGGGTIGAGATPFSVAVDPSGKYLFAVNNGSTSVSMYTIDATTGALTANGAAVATSGPNSARIAIDPTGRYAYVVNTGAPGGSVDAYSIDGFGRLVSLGAAIAAGSQPTEITIDPLARFVYVSNAAGNSLSMYAIGANGVLTSIGTQSQTGAGGVAADPTGRFLFSTTRTLGAPAKVVPYTINTNGTLTAGTPVNGSGTMTAVVADPTGRFVFAIDSNNSFIWAYAINQTTGAITAINMSGTGPLPDALSVDPQGKFVYTTNLNGTISIFSINQGTGALTLVSTVAAGNTPRGIVVSR